MTGHKLIYNDSTHAYWLDGRRVKSVTAVAKMVSDSFALDQWRKRQVAIGMMLEPRLAERVAVDPDNKETVDAVAEEAMKIAGAHHAADRGTQRHRASELADTGGVLLTDQQRADAAAWAATIEHHGITILPEYVEGFAIWPQYGVVGRFDRIGLLDGRPVIIDLKSGENAVKYPQSTAAQLALYGRAPLISARASTAGDKTTVTEWTETPLGLDLMNGYVILLGDDMEIGELWRIDIAHGWLGAQHALNLVNWRKQHNYGAELAQPVVPLDEPRAIQVLSGAFEVEGVPVDPMPSPALELLHLIDMSASDDALTALWREYRAIWTDEHTAAARERKAALSRRHQSLREVAAR